MQIIDSHVRGLPTRPSHLYSALSPSSGATRSALQAATVRTAKACASAPTVAATTSTGPASASRASAARTAGTGCVHPANTACTVNAAASARTSTHSGGRRWAGNRLQHL